MSRFLALCCLSLLLASALSASDSLASRCPEKPILYAEAADFAAVLKSMRNSSQLGAWYATASYEAFRDTKLAQKLGARFGELESLIGAGVNLANLQTVAGRESAFALYDIGSLEFLYVSRIDSGQFAASALGPLRKRFDERRDGALTYYARERDDGALAFAFTFEDGALYASNKVELLERAIALPRGGDGAGTVAAESRMRRPAALETAPWDIRVLLDQARLCENGYFRTYWIFRNASELAWMETAYLTARLTPDGVEERRVFLPAAAPSSVETTGAAGPAQVDLASLAGRLPGTLPHVSLVASPPPGEAADALLADILRAPRTSAAADPAAELARDLGKKLAAVRLDAMARVARPTVDPSGHYTSSARAIVLFGAPASAQLAVSLEGPVKRWISLELTGEPDAKGLTFGVENGVRGLGIPFGGGRGFYAAALKDALVVASDAALAVELAGSAASQPLPDRAWFGTSPLRSLRYTDLARGRAAFKQLVLRCTADKDPLRETFGQNWGGLLDSFSGVSRILERSWAEGDVVRQSVDYRYGP